MSDFGVTFNCRLNSEGMDFKRRRAGIWLGCTGFQVFTCFCVTRSHALLIFKSFKLLINKSVQQTLQMSFFCIVFAAKFSC